MDIRLHILHEVPLSEADPVTSFDPDAFARKVHENTWNGNMDISSLEQSYEPDFLFEGATNREFAGLKQYEKYVQELRSAFPDLQLRVDEVYWMGNLSEGFLISTRWSATATHLGMWQGRAPKKTPVKIWGITQWRVSKEQKVTHEWQLFNEFDLMMQIVAASSRTQD